MPDFTLSQMIEGFLLSKTVQGLSAYTIANYRYFLDKFVSFVGPDIPFSSITTDHITRSWPGSRPNTVHPGEWLAAPQGAT